MAFASNRVRWSYVVTAIAFLVAALLMGIQLANPKTVDYPDKKKLAGLEITLLLIAFIIYVVMQVLKKPWLRYVDWMLTTPLMILVLIYFYQRYPNFALLIVLPMAAFFMCLFGLILPRSWALGVGFAFLALIFIWQGLEQRSQIQESPGPFILYVLVWSAYGLAFWFFPNREEYAYDILDLVAKPVFAILLAAGVFPRPLKEQPRT